jgi:NADPH:quinone reductase-like Zn-dependent oxidoreductase
VAIWRNVPARQPQPSCDGLIEAGKENPVIGATYPLSDVPDAMRQLGTGHGRGKVVIAA